VLVDGVALSHLFGSVIAFTRIQKAAGALLSNSLAATHKYV